MSAPAPTCQRGAAILIAMLVVALAATVAASLFQGLDLSLRQAATMRAYEQAVWVLRGGLQWSRSILAQDARTSALDHGRELWATGLPTTEIEQGAIGGEIRDQQGLFNVNNLVRGGQASAQDIAAFKRLLELVGLDAGLAETIADWIDADQEPLTPASAEDAYYLRLAAPYRAANQPIAELGELLRVRGADEAIVAILRTVATALPGRTAVNVNLAPPEVLAAVVSGLTLSEARILASGRAEAPFRDLDEFVRRLPRRKFQWEAGALTVKSDFFLVQGRARVGAADVRMEALLHRRGGPAPAVVWQRMR